MRLTHIFIGIFVFVLFGIIIMKTAIDLNTEFNTTTDDDFMQIYRNISGMEDDMTSLTTTIGNKAPGGEDSGILEDSSDYEGGVIRSSWAALSNIPTIYNIFKGMLIVLSRVSGIPVIFFNIAFAIFVLTITFILISSILRHRL